MSDGAAHMADGRLFHTHYIATVGLAETSLKHLGYVDQLAP